MLIGQGPLQFIHFSQLLQKFHFSSNEDHSSFRSARAAYYVLAGAAERGRLGVVNTKLADRWEAKLLDRHGVKPIYFDGRFGKVAGYAVVNPAKARNFLAEFEQRSGARRTTAGEINNRGGTGIRASGGETLGANQRISFIDIQEMSSREISRARTEMSKMSARVSVGMKAAAPISFRLSQARFGNKLSVFRGEKPKYEQSQDRKKQKQAFKEKMARQRASEIKSGTSGVLTRALNRLKHDGTREKIEELSEEPDSGERDRNRAKVVATGLSVVAVADLVCASQAVGDSILEVKQGYAKKMMRMGSRVVTGGDQIRSGDKTTADELDAESDFFVDEESGTTWNQASTIRQELGKEPIKGAKYQVPKEASAKHINDKPFFFDLIDKPGINQGCDVYNAITGLPIISHAYDAAAAVIKTALNVPLAAVGTDVETLTAGLISSLAGKAINAGAQGAEFGNLANVGAHYAANDNAISMGGRALEDTEVAQLNQVQQEVEQYKNSQKTFFARYFDASDINSLAGSMLLYMPDSSEIASIISPTKVFGSLGSSLSSLLPGVNAAEEYSKTEIYDGVPKFGFSLSEEFDERFENPYENAEYMEAVVTDDGKTRMEVMNDKYGKCFGMKVLPDGDRVRVESDEAVNVFEMETEKNGKYKACYENTESLLRYRFYLTDVVASLSAACYEEEDETACSALGIETAQQAAPGGAGGGGPVSGDAQELAKELIDSGKVTGDPRYFDQLKQYANGNFDCNINQTILELMVGLVRKGHSFQISSLNRFCTGVLTASGTASYHYSDGGGHAVDFGIVDGVSSTGGTAADLKLLKDAFEYMPSGSGIGQVGCRPPGSLNLPDGISEFSDSCNHIHIQVPKG
jgi:hypothetical protein